jgi:hypothetical protein
MKKLFINNPLFRLLSPFATGALVYLLILLINNNIEQVQENFLGEELYICVGLSFLIQEFSRISIIALRNVNWHNSFFLRSALQFLVTLCVSTILVTGSMNIYFRYFLGYSPNFMEIMMFNILFSFITLIYWLLYTGHQLLYMINSERLEKEERAIQEIEQQFSDFKGEINTELLFECLENLLVVMKEDPDKAEDLTDHFAMLYRYMLLKREDELIDIKKEIETLSLQTEVYENLPYRRINIKVSSKLDGNIVPLTLLKIIEKIIKSTIVSEHKTLVIEIETGENDWISITYEHDDKLGVKFDLQSIQDIVRKYKFYSDKSIFVGEREERREIYVPKLYIE